MVAVARLRAVVWSSSLQSCPRTRLTRRASFESLIVVCVRVSFGVSACVHICRCVYVSG
jgi:hypothetical protein